MLSAIINLNVPALEDNGVAFANNAAWQNYWSNIEITAEFNGVDNTLYAESAYDNTLLYAEFTVAAVDYVVPTREQFESLLLAYQTLNTNYKFLRDEMKAAGFLTRSQ